MTYLIQLTCSVKCIMSVSIIKDTIEIRHNDIQCSFNHCIGYKANIAQLHILI